MIRNLEWKTCLRMYIYFIWINFEEPKNLPQDQICFRFSRKKYYRSHSGLMLPSSTHIIHTFHSRDIRNTYFGPKIVMLLQLLVQLVLLLLMVMVQNSRRRLLLLLLHGGRGCCGGGRMTGGHLGGHLRLGELDANGAPIGRQQITALERGHGRSGARSVLELNKCYRNVVTRVRTLGWVHSKATKARQTVHNMGYSVFVLVWLLLLFVFR